MNKHPLLSKLLVIFSLMLLLSIGLQAATDRAGRFLSLASLVAVLLCAVAVAMAGGYALWNLGILRGNLTLLATASYTAPVLSSAWAWDSN